MIFDEEVLFGGNANIPKGDIPGIGTGDTVGAGESEMVEGDIPDGALRSIWSTAFP